ncbi:MAG TPA: transaldolase [Propionibacteriaceae bacterium]|nr:transaldolase [Propionibacteriaceae bacterium]
MNERMRELSEAGVSVWLDDLSRERLTSGNLAGLIRDYSVVGVTTNPTIFDGAIGHGNAYDSQLAELRDKGVDTAEAITQLTTTDVRDACDLFAETYRATGGKNGRVSIEVEPGIAHDTEATIARARELRDLVGRDELFVKIPATKEGLPAITASIAAGISINVTLIFSLERYRAVVDAYLSGLERAEQAGIDLSGIRSVASLFVSRVDVEIDKRLDAIGGEALSLKGKAGLANAQLVYTAYEELFGSLRFARLQEKGAHDQRPLWASTGVKTDDYPDTLYVSNLVAPNTVNTMPEKTLLAYADHGEIGDPVIGKDVEAAATMKALETAGIDLADVFVTLENEGVAKFEKSWDELGRTVQKALVTHP